MNRKRLLSQMIGLMLGMLLLVACGTPQPPTSAHVPPTATPTFIPSTATPTAVPPTPTPIPPPATSTPIPTDTATPTHTPTETPRPTSTSMSTQTATPSATYTQTPTPAFTILENGHWYQPVDTPMSWPAARDYCLALGGHLVTVGSASENTFVHNLFANGWLGATDEIEQGVWRWVTGEPWDFSNWSPGEPNNCCPPQYCGGDGCTPEHYLSFWGDPHGEDQWNDVPDGKRPFVCERENSLPKKVQ
jgi:hypothetical protein